MPGLPAVLGGDPVFSALVPVSSSTLPDYSVVEDRYKDAFQTGMITNWKYVKEYEDSMAKFLDVKEAVAVASCTAGLLLTLKCLELEGEVILPSFTFSVSGHVLDWNNLTPVYVDIDPETCLINPKEVEKAITPNTCAILGVHIWGNPCAADQLQEIADRHDLVLVFDAAQATGSRYLEKPVGSFGKAEVFSCSPTKVVTSGEGGIIATNDETLAAKLRVGRNYGDDGSYDCEFHGINGRMSELNAILGLASLQMGNANIERRLDMFELYQNSLGEIPGISFPKITPGGVTNGVYFSIIIDDEKFGLSRDQVYMCLKSDNIDTRRYYYPPLHQQSANTAIGKKYEGKLPVTDYMSGHALTLPMFSHLTDYEVIGICKAIKRLQDNADTIRSQWSRIETTVNR